MIKFEEYSKYFNIIKIIPDTDHLIGYNTTGRMEHLKSTYYLAFPKLKNKKLEQLIIDLILNEKVDYMNVYDFSIFYVDVYNHKFFRLTYNQCPVVFLSSLAVKSETDLNDYLNEFLTEKIGSHLLFFKKFSFIEENQRALEIIEENQKALEIFESLKENDIEFFDLTLEFSFKSAVWTISDLNILTTEKVEDFENLKIKKINKKNFFIII